MSPRGFEQNLDADEEALVPNLVPPDLEPERPLAGNGQRADLEPRAGSGAENKNTLMKSGACWINKDVY